LSEVEDGKIVVTGMGRAYDMIFRFLCEVRSKFANATKDEGIDGILHGILPREFGIVLALNGTTKVFVFEDTTLV
jgi:hypothetical protein